MIYHSKNYMPDMAVECSTVLRCSSGRLALSTGCYADHHVWYQMGYDRIELILERQNPYSTED